MLDIFTDEYFMENALIEAQSAFDKDEIPVGAIVVMDNKYIFMSCIISYTLSSYKIYVRTITYFINKIKILNL